MAGCSTHRTDHWGPGSVQQQHRIQNTIPVDIQPTEHREAVSELKELRDTLRAKITELVRTTDNLVESPTPRISTLKILLESVTEVLENINNLDRQIRDLLDIEDYEKGYEESDKYLYMIFSAKWLLTDKISKMSLMWKKLITQRVTNLAPTQVAAVQTTSRSVITSTASRIETSECEDPLLITYTATAEIIPLPLKSLSASINATLGSRIDSVQSEERLTEPPESHPDHHKPVVSMHLITNTDAMNTDMNRRKKRRLRDKPSKKTRTAKLKTRRRVCGHSPKLRPNSVRRSATSSSTFTRRVQTREVRSRKVRSRPSRYERPAGRETALIFFPATQQSAHVRSSPILTKTVIRKQHRTTKHRWKTKLLTNGHRSAR